MELLTTEEIAARLRVSDATVRRWCRNGELKAQRAGRQYRITENDLKAFLNKDASEAKKAEAPTALTARASISGIPTLLAG